MTTISAFLETMVFDLVLDCSKTQVKFFQKRYYHHHQLSFSLNQYHHIPPQQVNGQCHWGDTS